MAKFAIKVKSKNGQNVITSLMQSSTVIQLKTELESVTKIPANNLHVLFGFPPKPLEFTSNEATLNECGIISGETLIVEEQKGNNVTNSSKPDAVNGPERELEGNRSHILDESIMDPGILMKQIVPADNSCLFTSVGYALNGRVDTTVGTYMRELIGETVKNDPYNYSEAILGKPPLEYCDWIRKPESWGGAIELAVLSEFYGIEIDVVDTLNAVINRFGEDKRYSHRIFLMFDGIHYDPLYLEPFNGGSIQTLFRISEESLLKQAEQLAMEAKTSRQYTDVNKFTLKCLVCNVLFTGQIQARTHAQETGHNKFGEV